MFGIEVGNDNVNENVVGKNISLYFWKNFEIIIICLIIKVWFEIMGKIVLILLGFIVIVFLCVLLFVDGG